MILHLLEVGVFLQNVSFLRKRIVSNNLCHLHTVKHHMRRTISSDNLARRCILDHYAIYFIANNTDHKAYRTISHLINVLVTELTT